MRRLAYLILFLPTFAYAINLSEFCSNVGRRLYDEFGDLLGIDVVARLNMDLSGDGKPKHFSDGSPPHPIEMDSQEPWIIRPLTNSPHFENLYALTGKPEYRKFFSKLGISRTSKGDVNVSPQKVLNDALAEMGNGFRVARVNGIIPLESWLELVASGKLPVGDSHDLMTHASAILLMPPEVAHAYQAQVGILLKIKNELDPPLALRERIDRRLSQLGGSFEGHSYEAGSHLVDGNQALVASTYWNFLWQFSQPSAGAAKEVQDLSREVSNWQIAGFSTEREAVEFTKRLDILMSRSEKEDPRYRVRLTTHSVKILTKKYAEKVLNE